MANRQALRELQTRLAERLQVARTQGVAAAWLAVEAGGQKYLFPLSQSGEIFPWVSAQPVPYTQPWFVGVANLRAVLCSTPGQAVALRGLRGGWFPAGPAARHPLAPVAVGALFALSFDTMALAAMCAISGTAVGGFWAAVALGAAFAAGMLLTDGSNGWWLARVLARGGAGAARASRATAALVAVVSLGVAALGVARWLSPAADDWVEGAGVWLGAALLTTVLGIATALWWRQRHSPTPSTPARDAAETECPLGRT